MLIRPVGCKACDSIIPWTGLSLIFGGNSSRHSLYNPAEFLQTSKERREKRVWVRLGCVRAAQAPTPTPLWWLNWAFLWTWEVCRCCPRGSQSENEYHKYLISLICRILDPEAEKRGGKSSFSHNLSAWGNSIWCEIDFFKSDLNLQRVIGSGWLFLQTPRLEGHPPQHIWTEKRSLRAAAVLLFFHRWEEKGSVSDTISFY